MRRRRTIKQEGERRSVFLRYLGEVATAVSEINGLDRQDVYDNLVRVAERKTQEADTKLDKHGKKVEDPGELFGDNVLIVDPANADSAASEKARQQELFDDSNSNGRPVRARKK